MHATAISPPNMLYSYLGRWFLSADLFLDSKQTLGNAQEVDGLRDTEEWRDYNHSAQATLEEGGDAFVLQSFPESESFLERAIIFIVRTHVMQSATPLKTISPSAFFNACRRVLMTSKGLTASAAIEPAAHPDKNDT